MNSCTWLDTPFRLPWARWSGCWRGATRPLPPATVAPPGDRQSPISTVILGRQPAEAPSPPD
eukprot:5833375-Prymnesium_polylepis.1